MEAFLAAFDALPLGTFKGIAFGKTYMTTRSQVAGGRGEKLIANALDGSDYISLNLYRLRSGTLLKPCEMPEQKVIAFVVALTVEPDKAGTSKE